MTMTNPNLMCVFDEPAMADDAVNTLESAGFGADQIYYSSRPNTSGFFASLRNLFTTNDDTNVSHDLKDLGLTSDEAKYYQQQYRAGRAIVAVRAEGRDQDALSILRSFGAHIYGTQQGAAQAGAYDANMASADRGYSTAAGAPTNAYQNDQVYSNAGAGTGAYADQQTYRNAGTGAGTYQNDPTLNNATPGAGTYQQNDQALNNAGTYQQSDPAYTAADRGANAYQNDRAYNNNNVGTGAGTYQRNERDANTYADAAANEQRRMRARDAQNDVPMNERARESYDTNRDFDDNM